MDPQAEYGVTKSDTTVAEGEEAPADTQTASKGLFGFGGNSDSSDVDSEEGKERQTRPEADAGVGGTDYSIDSVEGGRPSGGTDYSAATLEGGQPTGGTDYSGASVEGGHPTGGTNYSGADLGIPGSQSTPDTTADSTPEPEEKKKHHLFGL